MKISRISLWGPCWRERRDCVDFLMAVVFQEEFERTFIKFAPVVTGFGSIEDHFVLGTIQKLRKKSRDVQTY